MKNIVVSALATLTLLGLSTSARAQSTQQADSWNLSRIMMTNDLNGAVNPTPTVFPETGVWSFMQLPSIPSIPANNTAFTLLPSYTVNCLGSGATPPTFDCWQPVASPSSLPLIGVSAIATVNFNNGFSNVDLIQGMTMLHPSPSHAAVVAWTSPAQQNVRILGRVADVDNACGDGVYWAVMRDLTPAVGSPVTGVVPYSTTLNSATTFVAANVPVLAGTRVYFVIQAGNPNTGALPDHYCDSTTLDVLISKL